MIVRYSLISQFAIACTYAHYSARKNRTVVFIATTPSYTTLISEPPTPTPTSTTPNPLPTYNLYFENTNLIKDDGQNCDGSQAEAKKDCRPVLIPGTKVKLRWDSINVPTSFGYTLVRLKSEILCDSTFHTIETTTTTSTVDQSSTFLFTVPGKGVSDYYGDIECTENLHNLMDFSICFIPQLSADFPTQNQSHSISITSKIFTDHFVDYKINQMSCLQTYVRLQTPSKLISVQNTLVAPNLLPNSQNNITANIVGNLITIIFICLSIFWFLGMYFSYRWRKKVYNEAKTGMYAEDETPETKNLEWEMLSRLIDNKKLKKKVTALKKQREIEEDYVGIERDIENSSGNIFAFAGETSINGSTSAIAKKRENGSKSDTHQRHKMSYEILDDFYGRPPKSRIKKLGRNGLSWRLLYMMLPWRILNIGKSTLTVSGNDKLYLMPQVFTLNVTYRVSVQIFTIILIAFGALIYRFSPSLYVPGMITGFYWMLGGLIFGLLLLWLDTRMTRKYEKGMLKLLRSIGEPKIPEIMFSYSWACRKKCVRTLAHSLWRSGIGVWIDSIKLVSGDTLEQDVRRAVREVNFTVIFLSPNYVKSRNCQIEFTEAIKTPGKLHVHVSDWNSEVEKVVARLIEDIKLSKNRITAHSSAENKAGLVRGIWKYLSSSISKKKVNKDEEEGLASKSSKLISNLKKTGRGWADLTAVLHNYSKRSGNSWDFGWWLMNTQSGGGIPNCAPCPPKVEKWNLRPFYPLSNPVRNIRDYFAWKSGVKIGNVYISGDCSKTGTNGSAIPWKFLIFLVVALFPLLDIIDFNFQETKLRQFTDNCITELSRQISSKNNGVDVRNAVCNKFYELPIFTTPNSGYEVGMYSAYKNEVVIQGFSKLYNSNCNQTVQATTNLKNPAAVQYLVPCTADLTMWFANNASFIPRGIVWAVICMISVLFLLTIFTNLEKIVETTFRIPTCLRPLLAVSNLKQAPKDLPSTAKPTLLRRLTKMGSSLGTMATDILKEEAPVSYTPPAIPLLYVRVHGRGEIADNLRKFFNNLDRHLPDTIQCRDIFTLKKKSEEISIVKNNVTKDGDGFAWVNIFIMSDVEDMKLFYELNQQNKIDLEVSVVILDHQPLDREEKIEYDVLKFKDWNMLKEDEVWSSWIRTIVYIESRYRIKGKLGVVEELKNFEMGYEVVMNASLRTKNALFKYGEEVFCDSIYGK